MGGGEGSHRVVFLGLPAAFGCVPSSRPADQGGGPDCGCGGKRWKPEKAGGDFVQGGLRATDLR